MRQTRKSALVVDAGLALLVIDLIAHFTSIRAAEMFYWELQLDFKPADLSEQLYLADLNLLIVLVYLSLGEQLASCCVSPRRSGEQLIELLLR